MRHTMKEKKKASEVLCSCLSARNTKPMNIPPAVPSCARSPSSSAAWRGVRMTACSPLRRASSSAERRCSPAKCAMAASCSFPPSSPRRTAPSPGWSAAQSSRIAPPARRRLPRRRRKSSCRSKKWSPASRGVRSSYPPSSRQISRCMRPSSCATLRAATGWCATAAPCASCGPIPARVHSRRKRSLRPIMSAISSCTASRSASRASLRSRAAWMFPVR